MARLGTRLAALALLVSACTTASTPTTTLPVTTTAQTSTTTTSTTLATTTSTSVAPTTTSTEPPVPLGLYSPSGVPVAILSMSFDGSYSVMTPCGNETTLETGEPIYEVDVVIDPGHGGPIDTGAVSPTGITEKALNLEVAQITQALLNTRSITSVLTRTADYPTPLSVRAHLADTLQAAIMVSIHHNAPTPGPSDVPGIEIFIQQGSDESARLGGILWEHSMAALGMFDVAWAAAPDAGVMTVLNTRGTDAYGIIRNPSTPTALIELGYISNPAEAELHRNPSYAFIAGRALADAIEAYLTTEEQGSGFSEGRVFNPSPGVGRDVCVEPDLG